MTLPPDVEGALDSEARPCFDTAIRAVGELAMALSSAISDVAFADAVRLRAELGQALSRAAELAALLDPAEREAAVQQLVAMRGVADRLFQTAPAPSTAVVAAANAGDRAAWDREEQAWISDRLASGTNPRIPQPRRARRDTRPESPKAWGAMLVTDPNAIDESARADLVQPPSADEDDPR